MLGNKRRLVNMASMVSSTVKLEMVTGESLA